MRELSNRIVTERMNNALLNVVKDEYNKKITIICKESNQNQAKAASKYNIIQLFLHAILAEFLFSIIIK